MAHQIFRRIHLLALVAGSATIQLPGASGDNVQYMPASQADALVASERADAYLLPAERQKQFFKNGIAKIDPEDYYAHDVRVNGQSVTEYRIDEPEASTFGQPKPAAPAFDVNQMAGAMGSAMAIALHSISQTSEQAEAAKYQAQLDGAKREYDQQQKPASDEPQGDAKLAQQRLDQAPADQALATTVANVEAVNSEFGATNPAQDMTAESAATATDAGNPTTDQSSTAQADTAKPVDKTTAAPSVPSGRPGASRAATKAAKAAADAAADADAKGSETPNA